MEGGNPRREVKAEEMGTRKERKQNAYLSSTDKPVPFLVEHLESTDELLCWRASGWGWWFDFDRVGGPCQLRTRGRERMDGCMTSESIQAGRLIECRRLV